MKIAQKARETPLTIFLTDRTTCDKVVSMTNRKLEQWLMNYQFQDSHDSERTWIPEFEQFKKALKEFWLSQNVIVNW